MAAELLKRVQGTAEQKKLQIMVGDFLEADLPYFDVCVSNTPYRVKQIHCNIRNLFIFNFFRSLLLLLLNFSLIDQCSALPF